MSNFINRENGMQDLTAAGEDLRDEKYFELRKQAGRCTIVLSTELPTADAVMMLDILKGTISNRLTYATHEDGSCQVICNKETDKASLKIIEAALEELHTWVSGGNHDEAAMTGGLSDFIDGKIWELILEEDDSNGN